MYYRILEAMKEADEHLKLPGKEDGYVTVYGKT